MTESVILDYDDTDFAVRARRLIASGTSFSFEVRGEAFGQLRPLLLADQVSDFGKLVLKPKLQVLAGILSYARVKERATQTEQLAESFRVRIGRSEQ